MLTNNWIVTTTGLIIVANLLVTLALLWTGFSVVFGAPWIPASFRHVRRALTLVGLGPGEEIVDLGSGDGRFLIIAAREYGATALGVEIDPVRCLISRMLVRMLGLSHAVKVTRGNLYRFNQFQSTNVVILHLARTVNRDLSTVLATRLRVGTRVVSLKFPLEAPNMRFLLRSGDIYVYEAVAHHPLD